MINTSMINLQTLIPEPLRGCLCITEVDAAEVLAGSLFRRKYNDDLPDERHHIVGLYVDDDRQMSVIGYSHMRPFGDIYLSGGSCTDGDAVRAMAPAHREALSAAGGMLFLLLRYAFRRYAEDCDAFFGYSGDRRALEVTHAAGFEDTMHPNLIVHWHKPMHEHFRRALVAKAHALGPF